MFYITKRFTFESSHRLNDNKLSEKENKTIFGRCNNKPSHGHSYKMFVTVGSKHLNNGMVINFNELKKIVNEQIIERLDHQFLNDIVWLGKPTTCENMLLPIAVRIKNNLPEGVQLRSLEIFETEGSSASVKFEVE